MDRLLASRFNSGLRSRAVACDPVLDRRQFLRDKICVGQNALVGARRNDPSARSLVYRREARKFVSTRAIGKIRQEVRYETIAEGWALLCRQCREIGADKVPG